LGVDAPLIVVAAVSAILNLNLKDQSA
jgi:hypothetical protein